MLLISLMVFTGGVLTATGQQAPTWNSNGWDHTQISNGGRDLSVTTAAGWSKSNFAQEGISAAGPLTGVKFKCNCQHISLAISNDAPSGTSGWNMGSAFVVRPGCNYDIYDFGSSAAHTYSGVPITPLSSVIELRLLADNRVEHVVDGVVVFTSSMWTNDGGLLAISWYSANSQVQDIEYIGTTSASATGDPHLQNVHGERFDLMKPGNHVLVSIPRGERAEDTLLRVDAEARRLGGQCNDIYFTELNITGSWAYEKKVGGFHYTSQSSAHEPEKWITLGKIELKVVHGQTESDTPYLNFYIKHLGRAGFAVGGLLGEEDHEAVSTPPAACVQRVSLENGRPRGSSSPAASAAVGTFV
jgi:hypothetical protein